MQLLSHNIEWDEVERKFVEAASLMNNVHECKPYLRISVFTMMVIYTAILPFRVHASAPSSMLVYTRFRGGLDPARVFNPFEESLLRCTYQSLLKVDTVGRLTGDLAESWEFSSDKRSVIFKIKKAYFADGSLVTSKDVVRSFRRLTNKESAFMQKQLLLDLIGPGDDWVRALGIDRVEIRLPKPYPPLLSLLSGFEFSIAPSPKVREKFRNGSGKYLIRVIRENEEFEVRKKGSSSIVKKVKVTSDIGEVSSALRGTGYDLIVSLPIYQASTLTTNPRYQLNFANRYNPFLLELNKDKEIFKDRDFRRALKSFIFNTAKESKVQSRANVVPTQYFIPPGLMLPEYYLGGAKIEFDISVFREKWGSRIDSYGLYVWVPKKFFPDDFVDKLSTALKFVSKNSKVFVSDYAEVSRLFENGKIDISALDPSAYFADPDSFLYLWRFNRPNFPFPGDELMRNIRQFRSLPAVDERLRKYAAEILTFENEAWTIPVFQTKYPIFKLDGVDLPDVNLTTFNLLCP